MKDIYTNLGETLKRYRKAASLTQAELAEMANLSLNFLGQIERSTKKASLETVQKLADALNLPVNKLFVFEEEAKKGEVKRKGYNIGRQIEFICREASSSDQKFILKIAKKITKKR